MSSTQQLIDSIRNEYMQKGFVFVSGDMIKKILLSLGASFQDIENLSHSGEDLAPDPTMPRMSRNGRFGYDYENYSIQRLEQTPFILKKTDGFIRKDSDKPRIFGGIEAKTQTNTAFQCLLKLQAIIIKDYILPDVNDMNNDQNKQVSTIFQIRTIKKANSDNKNIYEGQPAPEGAHCDIGPNKGHIATIFIQGVNLDEKSAITNLYSYNSDDLIDIIGKQSDQIDHNKIQITRQHTHFLDTIFFVDAPHTVTPIVPKDITQIATRDMLLLMTRRYKNNESMGNHPEFPCCFDM